MKRVLIVEDSPKILESLCDMLAAKGFSVSSARLLSEAREKLRRQNDFDLLILDWELPDGSGVDLCREYRDHKGASPVLILTARVSIDDKEEGLDSGADDYLCKPFSVAELLARVESLLKRPRKFISPSAAALDFEKSTFSWKKQVEIELPSTELHLLEFLMRHPSRVFSAKELLEKVWPDASDTTELGVRACIHRLKERLNLAGCPDLLKSSKGFGYSFSLPENDDVTTPQGE